MASGEAGSQYWVQVEDEDAWVLATVTEKFGGSVHMKRFHAPDGVPLELAVSDADFEKLTPAAGNPEEAVPDLVSLMDVNTGAVLHNLRLRYQNDEIFTAIGPIIISVNPYKKLDICSAEALGNMKEDPHPDALPPHVFKIAHSTYTTMMRSGGAQSVLISGESGAGKTETTKLCLACLAEISGSSGKGTEAALESGVLLEAFGNAKTVHNNNSSRFGKWVAVYFDDAGHISTCKVQSYLLEKSRVVTPGVAERNYHIFYSMVAGASAEERAEYLLKDSVADYMYLSQGPAEAEGINDSEEWASTTNKMEILGFTPEQQASVFRLLSGVLLMGNIKFVEGEKESQKAEDPSVLEQVSELFKVSAQQLSSALTSKKVTSGRGSSYTVPLTQSQCYDTRDALSKAIYTALFDWIVSRLNIFMQGNAIDRSEDEEDELFIGLLDVFGFENFEFNSLEQLCINFTNERLQQQFMNALVKLQQEDYQREGIQSTHISFPDNTEQLDLLDAKMGIMGMLDEECALPKGSEEAYVDKMHKKFVGSSIYAKPGRGGPAKRKSVLPSSIMVSDKDLDKLQFCVTHYAGKVTYTALGWMDKNRGFLQPDLAFLMSTSSNALLESLFPPATKKDSKDKKGSTTLATFRNSLRALSATLLQTKARYIRCIKPNADKVPGRIDGQFVERQLRYTGVSAVVEIQRSGYPVSLPKADFIARYRCCAFSCPDKIAQSLDSTVVCTNLFEVIEELIGNEVGSWLKNLAVQMGKTKVFMREEVVKLLENARDAVWTEGACGLQRAARRRIALRTVKLAREHQGLARSLEAALDNKSVAEAGQLLEKLKAAWTQAMVSVAASPALLKSQREVGLFEVRLQALEEVEKGEQEAFEELKKAIASKEFVALKVALQVAQEVSQGVCKDLTTTMAEAEAMLNEEAKRIEEAEAEAKKSSDAQAEEAARQKIEEFKRWEAEVEAKARERELERKKKLAEAQELDAGDGMEQLVIEVRNDTRPEKGIGIELNAMNTVVALLKGGLAAKDGKLKIGDIVTAVDGVSVKGKKATSAMNETATTYKFTVSRYKTEVQAALHAGVETEAAVDMEGWLFQVKALDGRAIKLPKKRWVVLQGTTLSWYEDSTKAGVGGREQEQSSQSLMNAACTLPLRSTNYAMTPAMKAFADMRKFPFMISWPNGSVKHELVFAASTTQDRAAWANALKEGIGRAKTGAPTAGWLFKEGGRKSGLSFIGWKRRWFVLPAPGRTDQIELKYYDSPTATASNSKGSILLKGSDVFVPKEVKGIKKEYQHNFCLASEGVEKGKPVTLCTLLAATSADERDMWVSSIGEAIKHINSIASPATADLSGAPPMARGGKVGADAGAGSIQANASLNVEQLKALDPDELLTLRAKQLKAILDSMGLTYADALEKRDLVAKIVKYR
mmetsp:Transcript_31792/g.66569  ORF Transcript_31792/g.66569 Transcript_31792/m.66569 type:complete len:1417 (+) Transcript_31792:14-4264(+)